MIRLTTKDTKITKRSVFNHAEGTTNLFPAFGAKDCLRSNARLLQALLVLFVSLVVQNPAFACSCVALTPERSAVIFSSAEQIFEGRIVALDTKLQPEEDFDYTAPVPVPDSPLYSKARLRVLTSYKGVPEGEKLEAYIDTLTSCGYMLQIGDVTNFLLTRKDDVLVQAGLCDMPDMAGWEAFRVATPE